MLFNGTPKIFFNIARGLRKGDPISPFLFIIMVQALGISFTEVREDGLLKGVKITSELDPITHQQFADDIMLFGIGDF